MASSQFHPRDVKSNSPSPTATSGVNFHARAEEIDDIATVQEEAEIIIAYRLSPQRPRAITSINRRDNYYNHSTISSLSSGNALAAPPSPLPSILPSNTGTTTPTSTSVSHSGARPQDRLSEAARRCQEWVETRREDLHLSVLSSTPLNPQYPHGAGTAREVSRRPGAMDLDAGSATRTRKLSHTSEHARNGTDKGEVRSVLPTDPQGVQALVFDEAVGGWGKKLTEPGLSLTDRDPVVRGTPGYSRAPEGAESLLLVPGRLQPAEEPDRCSLRRRESHMTVTSVITIEDPEQTRLNELRAEREREKNEEEQELRERNKKKPPLRLLSLDGGGTRGYTMILLLEELMHQCFVSIHGRAPDARKGERPPKPCEIFDLIGGTGIGGVIGIFLGRLRLSVAELKDMYPSLMQSILQQNRRMFGVPFRSTLFKASKLVDTLRATIRQQGIITDSELPKDPFDSDEEGPPGEPFGCTKNYVTPTSKYRRDPATPNMLVSAATFCESRGVAPQHQNHAQRRKSLDDASEAWTSFSDSSDKGCKALFRGGFAKKKSLNDLRAGQATSAAASEVPPVPNVDPKHLDDSTAEGNSDEILYDARAGRCRTFVTAVLKGSFYDQDPALLRSYNSPAEALLEPKCAIWQACAATTAVQIMFKPFQIGQHIFHDEGPSSYNPTPSVLKEAAEHLWRGREIGCIASIGTGKVGSGSSPDQANSAERWEGIGGGIASFAAARKRLAFKLDACETVHREVKEKILRHYGVLNDDYFRFNVDLCWATSELCEWESLAELNTVTKRYLGKVDVHDAIRECGRRLGALEKVKEKMVTAMAPKQPSPTQNSSYDYCEPPYFKAELPADEPISSFRPAVRDPPATCAELPTEEAIPHSNREFFPPKSISQNFPGKRETFYIVSELPLFDKPPTGAREKRAAEMNATIEPQFGGDLLHFRSR